MRLAEVFGQLNEIQLNDQPLAVKATEQFRRDFDELLPVRKQNLLRFLELKRRAPQTQIGPEDRPFRGNPELKAKRLRHYHIVKGKLMAIYAIIDGAINLYAIVPHSVYDGKSTELLKTITDVEDYDVEQHEQFSISPAMKAEVDQLIYEMVADPDQTTTNVLRTVVLDGDFRDFKEFAVLVFRMYDDYSQLEDEEIMGGIVRAYGGPDGLQTFIRNAMKNVGR